MVRTEGDKFDSYLILQDKEKKVLAQDDDSAGNLNSRIVFVCPESDTYRVVATCLPPQISSDFRIDVFSNDGKASATLEAEP